MEGRPADAHTQFAHAGELVAAAASDERGAESRRNHLLSEIYAGKVAVYEQSRHWEPAERELELWLQLKPDDPRAHFHRGRVRYLESVKFGGDDKAFDAAYDEAKQL